MTADVMTQEARREEPVALVVGGASGIGAATARLLRRDGFRVAVADINETGAHAVAAEIGGRAYRVDVADEASVTALMDAVMADFKRLDALATPAGVVDTTSFLDLPLATFRRVLEINTLGTFLCVREAAKRMQPGGRICTVASVAGKRGGGLSGTAAYAASKGAVLALTRSAARSLAPLGIAVNAIAPGPVLTPMLEVSYRDPKHRERIEGMIPQARTAQAAEIAEAIAFLLSPKASYVHGETFTVDGGLSMD